MRERLRRVRNISLKRLFLAGAVLGLLIGSFLSVVVVRLPVTDVVYLKAELKYVTVRTSSRSYIHDASLTELEELYPGRFLRIHRNALVARRLAATLSTKAGQRKGVAGGGGNSMPGTLAPG